ncbi:hypothetical protein KEM56_007179 [Ascosphaera pollenicola]|nr:hypothetical protein KEM56_007179 [Ascosphaera pollenicola]
MSIRIDADSGQVFTDRRARTKLFTSALWAHERPFLPVGWGEGSEYGANSLKHMAMRLALADQRRLRPAHFKAMSWPLAHYLWINLGQTQTVYMWQQLSAAYPKHFYDVARYRYMRVSDLKVPFAEYLREIRDEACRWGVALTLATDFTRLSELLTLSNLSNLVALEIKTQLARQLSAQGESVPVRMTDRVIRSWSELASNGKAFQNLRLLMLRLQPDATEHIFSYLRQFPSLAGIAVVECPNLMTDKAIEVAEQNGWSVYVMKKRTQTCKPLYVLLTDYLESTDAKTDAGLARLKRTPLLEFAVELPLVEKRKLLPHIWLFTRDPMVVAAKHNGQPRDKRRMNDEATNELDAKKPKRRLAVKANARAQQDVFDLLAELQG